MSDHIGMDAMQKAARPTSALDEALNRLAKVLEEADHVASMLTENLRPVLRDTGGIAASAELRNDVVDRNGASPLVHRVNELTDRLRTLTDRLSGLTGALDI